MAEQKVQVNANVLYQAKIHNTNRTRTNSNRAHPPTLCRYCLLEHGGEHKAEHLGS